MLTITASHTCCHRVAAWTSISCDPFRVRIRIRIHSSHDPNLQKPHLVQVHLTFPSHYSNFVFGPFSLANWDHFEPTYHLFAHTPTILMRTKSLASFFASSHLFAHPNADQYFSIKTHARSWIFLATRSLASQAPITWTFALNFFVCTKSRSVISCKIVTPNTQIADPVFHFMKPRQPKPITA